jgi:hypothetical protein
MSQNQNELNEIDKKKNKLQNNDDNSSKPNYTGFTIGLLTYSFHIIISFVLVGSIGLYLCKIAQANVLPDDINFYPFGEKINEVEQIPINTNIVKVYGLMGLGLFLGQKPEKEESTKIVFNSKEVYDSYNKGIIGFLNSLKTNPDKSSYVGLYLNDVISSVIANNNWIINKLFGFLNQYLPESFIIIISPMISVILLIFMFFTNIILCFFYQLTNWSDFFKDKNVKNEKVSWKEPFTYFRPWRAFVLFLYCLFLFFPVVSCLPLFTTFYSIFSPLGINAKLFNTNINYGFGSFIKDVILYKSQLYLILLTFGLLTQSSLYLGINGIIGCIIGILIVIFCFHMYNQFIPNNTDGKYESDGLVSGKPAKVKVQQQGGGGKNKIKSKK